MSKKSFILGSLVSFGLGYLTCKYGKQVVKYSKNSLNKKPIEEVASDIRATIHKNIEEALKNIENFCDDSINNLNEKVNKSIDSSFYGNGFDDMTKHYVVTKVVKNEDEGTKVEENVSVEDKTSVVEETSVVEDKSSVVEDVSVAEDKSSVVEDVSTVDETPAIEETSTVEETPIVEAKTFSVEEAPAIEETSTVEETPIVEAKTFSVEEAPVVENKGATKRTKSLKERKEIVAKNRSKITKNKIEEK